MQFGFAPTQSQQSYTAMIQQVQLAESLGFETIWAHEHHTQAAFYPNPLMTLAVLAPVTRTIRLGTNMLLLPLHHPLTVAETGAMLDILAGGRFTLGVANGYSTEEFQALGGDKRRRGYHLTDGVELIRSLWSGEAVTRRSDRYQLDEFRLFPRPFQQPTPPIVIGGTVEKAIDRAARLGDGYLISTTETLPNVRERVHTYHAALERHDMALKAPLLNRIVCTVGSAAERDRARELYGKALLALYDAWGHSNITNLGGDERTFARLSEEHFILGEASECIEQILAYKELGIGHIACLMNFGSPDLDFVDRSMRLFGEKVLPHVAS